MGRPAADLLDVLRHQHATLATAESLTGGRLAALVTDVPEELVDRYGVVSPECAGAMARGVRGLTGATYGLSTTGVAGPEEQEGKPAGTVYVGVAGPDGDAALALELVGDRAAIQERTCQEALDALLAAVRGTSGGKNQASGSVGQVPQ